MGLVSPELSLGLRPSYVLETINGFLREVSMIDDVTERLEKVDDFVRRLEEEMKKIEVFKRELPLCMLLLKDAILLLSQEFAHYSAINAHQPVLEEFIPLKRENSGVNNQISDNNKVDGEDSSKDKKTWMSSVQLWRSENSPTNTTQNSNQNQNQNQTLVSQSQKENDKRDIFVRVELHNSSENRGGSQGFVPMIHTFPSFPEFRKNSNKENVSVPGLSLLIPGIEHPKHDTISSGFNSELGISRISSSASNGLSNIRPGHQQSTARKQRRCWSPELHRRFVDALSQLGGPQVATPKQIRELMRVDGLTNDEVKSHLQKYRIHSRQVPNVSTVTENENGNGLTSSWATHDQQSAGSKPSNSQSGSPEGPLQFPGFTGGTSTTGGDSMEDEEDEKSDSYSWKGHLHRPGKDDV